jgi:hypothetical protein
MYSVNHEATSPDAYAHVVQDLVVDALRLDWDQHQEDFTLVEVTHLASRFAHSCWARHLAGSSRPPWPSAPAGFSEGDQECQARYCSEAHPCPGVSRTGWARLGEAATAGLEEATSRWSTEPVLLVMRGEDGYRDLVPFRIADCDVRHLVPRWMASYVFGAVVDVDRVRTGVVSVEDAGVLFESAAHMEATLALWKPSWDFDDPSGDFEHVLEVARAL